MTLELAFHELDTRLAELQQAFDNVLWAVVQGQGGGWSHAVLDHYDAAAHDAVGLLREARDAAMATDGSPDLVRMRSALVTIQERFNALMVCFYTQLISYDRKTTLYSLRRKGRAWKTWISGVDDALAQCPQPLYDVSQVLLRCWQELVDRANLLYVSAQLNTIGTGRIVIEGGVRSKQAEIAATGALGDSTS
jgi:hypothetical protein